MMIGGESSSGRCSQFGEAQDDSAAAAEAGLARPRDQPGGGVTLLSWPPVMSE
ncbi:hypothetical protein SAMN02745121_05981 [Nannocystis exedens]|uniref:Uncharacterized protein n=1 Tax=Nannocystis exedens TaxID=54 RepID=A0A1I2EAT7_9BACT|nr:hypothetical protein NAEX_07940 [Nannocystis exedens]SFE89975.1 hypothetical protein SAMN02745121_05981 [Nannocystis exedens]